MTQHRGKQHQPEQQLRNHKHIFRLRSGSRQITDSRQGQCAPVEALQVLFDDVIRFGVMVHPRLRSKSIVLVDQVVKAAVPVKDDQKVVNERCGPKNVRVVGVSFGAIHERPESIDFDETKRSQNRIIAD